MRNLSLFVVLTLAACGSSSPEPAPAPDPAPAAAPEPTPAPAPAPAAEAVNAVTIEGDVAVIALEGNDQMQFNTKEIVVPAGKKVRLTLTHTGKLAAAAMGHNFVLLKAGTDGQAFSNAAATARDSGYIPEAMKGDVIAHTKVVGGGEADTIEFDAPPAGEYPFLCSFTGHYALMNGVFKVQ